MPLRWHKLWLSIGYLLLFSVVISSLSSPPPDSPIWRFDKLIHASAYCTLMAWFLQLYPQIWARCALALAFIALGAGLEVAQAFHPLRHFDYWDMLANSIGVLIAWGFGFTRFKYALLRLEQHLQTCFPAQH